MIARSFKELAEQSASIQDMLVKKEFENRLALLRRKLEIGHGKLLEPVDVSQARYGSDRGYSFSFWYSETGRYKGNDTGLQWADRGVPNYCLFFLLG